MNSPSEQVTIGNILKAYDTIREYVKCTPLIRVERLEELFDGTEIYLKLENMQYTGSFKVRGVANKMLSLRQEELERGVTAASSGNHAQAVAFMAKRLKTKAVIVMPEDAPATKVAGARRYGAEVVLCGFTGEDRDRKCNELIEKHNYSLVHSHTDPLVISGHATLIQELEEQIIGSGGFDEIVVPCGAGSLAAGAAIACKNIMPGVRFTAVEPANVPRFTESLIQKKPVTVEMGQTIADGLRVSKAEQINFEIIRDNVDTLLTIQEESIMVAVREIMIRAKIIAEPSACVGIAAALDRQIDMRAGRRVCFIISGGNVDTKVLIDVLTNEKI